MVLHIEYVVLVSHTEDLVLVRHTGIPLFEDSMKHVVQQGFLWLNY